MMGTMMEYLRIYMWIAIPVAIVISMKWAKGNWGEAIIGTIIAPLALSALWAISMIVMTIFAALLAEIFVPSGSADREFMEVFANWSSWAIVLGLYILYCIQARHGSEIQTGPALGGGTSQRFGGSAKGAWRSESVGVFRRRF